MLKKTETYHKLITAAAACFAEKGFSATSVREISTRAGISQGAMYTYFKSKDELVKAIVLEEQNSALTAHNATYAGSYFDRLCAQVTSCISEIGYPITHQLWVEIMAESARNPELRKRISPVMTSCGKASRGSSRRVSLPESFAVILTLKKSRSLFLPLLTV